MGITGKDILRLSDHPAYFPPAAQWFHSKWKVPVEAYLESMEQSRTASEGVPQWYCVFDGQNRIIGGLGVIDNDFHKRPDLTPNICAVYVESAYRRQGVARMLLETACADLAHHGIRTAYLITSHTSFYERCGWTFHCMAEEDDGNPIRVYRHGPVESPDPGAGG